MSNLIPINLPTLSESATSLDAHIKWTSKSGSIIQMGERIARITFYPHGLITHTGSVTLADDALATTGRSNIRARMKKRSVTTPTTIESTSSNLEGQKYDDANGVTIDIRSPASGFLRIVYHKLVVTNAITCEHGSFSAVNVMLGAVEPCAHPALVGSLCAVCGMDTRSSSVIDLTCDDNEESQHEMRQASVILRRKNRNSRPVSQFVEKQSSAADVTETTTDGSAHLANNSQNTASAAIAPSRMDSNPTSEATPQTSNVMNLTTSKSNNVRSLSSLLSGAKSTQEMQQPSRQHQRPPPRRNIPRPQSNTHHNTSSTTQQITVSGGETLTISEAEAKSISEADSKKLKDSKQLCLVLDLDHTLLHATDDCRAGRFVADEIFVPNRNDNDGQNPSSNETKSMTTAPNPQKRSDVRSILLPSDLSPDHYQQYVQRQQYQLQHCQNETPPVLPPIPYQKFRHFIKLRPNLKEFFESIESTYKISIYTAGTRAYAERIAVMICRHLVAATLDEEGLTALRTKVREKDEELKRYKNWVERRKQLKLANKRDATLDTSVKDEDSKAQKKVVLFSVDDEVLARKTSDSLNVDGMETCQGQNSTQLDNSVVNGDIPRKRKKVQSESLVSLLAPPIKASKTNTTEEKEEEMKDPSEARDALRKQLEEAEALEVKATSLRRKLFGSRIVTRTDVGDLGVDVKSLKRVFPCGGRMAAIVDDREDVWANDKNNDTGRPGEPPDNLLLVRPYHWKPFSGYRDVNNASGVDLSKTDEGKSDNDESDEDKKDMQLLWIADILKRLHERFYSPSLSQEDRDQLSVPSLLRTMRQEVLSKRPQANIVFSGVIPIQQQNVQTKVRLPLVRYAEELGAKISPDVTNAVTHVVAKRDGSEKIRRARNNPGCYIVYPSWLMECYWSITRQDVGQHHMGPMPRTPRECEEVHQTILFGESEDEDEDNFLDDLENEMLQNG